MQILEATGLVKKFGGLAAINNVSFHVNQGEILGLIGPNGAGKSTLFNLVSGAIPPDAGAVTYRGTAITRMKPDRICHLGIGRSFQIAKNFVGMPLRKNVLIGAMYGKKNRTRAEAEAIVDEVLEFVGLSDMAGRMVPDIPLAFQKRVEVARALATKPDLLLLDEMMAGLNPSEVSEAIKLVTKIRDSGITVIVIEHVMKAIMSICDRILVLHHGATIAEGTPEEIATSKMVIEVYLGEVEDVCS
jgi:branched-chain amino acid transport system ATP-binding protein